VFDTEFKIPVLFEQFIKQFNKLSFVALDPDIEMQLSPFVLNCIPLMETIPATEKVVFPKITTLGVNESHVYADKFTPAFNVMSSVYVPGLMKIVSPEAALVRAVAIVVCVPCPATGSTIHLAVPKLFVPL
jgi:hypothetical protein